MSARPRSSGSPYIDLPCCRRNHPARPGRCCAHDFEQFRRDTIQWISDGQFVSPETVREGLEAAPSALLEMFTGDVMGKMLVKL